MTRKFLGVVAALALGTSATACSYGIVQDAESSAMIGGATVQFRTPTLAGTSAGDVVPTLRPAVTARSWSSTDPGVGGGAGAYYLNPYAAFRFNDTRNVQVDPGWVRIQASRFGFDTRRIYRNHQYTRTDIPTAQGPYSAGPYPYVAANVGPFYPASQQTLGAREDIKLFRSTSNYIKNPDMIVDLRTLRDQEVSTNCEGIASRCLRVSVGTANVGDGDLWLRGNSNSTTVTQRRFRRDGSISVTTLPNAVFEFHSQHGHIHLQNWTNLRLRRIISDEQCGTESTAANCPVVGTPGRKLSFCLTETSTFDSTYTPNPNRASSCTFNSSTGEINQGIGSGREDVYGRSLPGQLIGIDGLPSGRYWLEVEVNPTNANGQRSILESDYSNNITRFAFSL